MYSCGRGMRTLMLLGLAALTTGSAGAVVVDFSGLPAGLVVAGERPDGTLQPGNLFPDFELTVENTGGGPDTLIIFDGSAPDGGSDGDGSPLGNLIIVAEDLVDVSPLDGLVDDPDDEAGGGMITFAFHAPVDLAHIVLVDVDHSRLSLKGLLQGQRVQARPVPRRSNNSVTRLDLSNFAGLDALVIDMGGSGGIAEIGYGASVVGNGAMTWSGVKSLFR